ncbi:purine-cytosine permease family protein [Pseudonocardia acaciae]|uniref:purine-cytosine permease family protein n=1 Tax=Pseudonocardia acaciae TaxID=551276 RepID=UPI00048C30E9|nr:cytosine permease [Pseudonocardia acaciae]
MAVEPGAPALIEKHTIGFVPENERHGRVRDLFTLWFGTNIAPLPIVTGAAGVLVYHLSFGWALSAIIVGHLVGGVFMALHSAQGPQMGIPQMIQSRGQFGSVGALLVVVIAAVMYLGFFASNIVLAGQSLHGIAGAVPVPVGVVIGAVGSGVICVIGYRFIHILNRIGTWVLGVGILAAFAWIIVGGVPADFWTRGGFSVAGWLATVSLAALWQIAFAPYVSDYSRYLPANVGVMRSFWATYLGCTLGSILPFMLGAVVALAAPADTETMQAVRDVTGSLGSVMLLLFLLSVISHNALNLYGAVLAVITCIQTYVQRWIPTARTRTGLSVIVIVVTTAVAIAASKNFLSLFVNLVLALLVVLVPWTAINLIDFYAIHKGNYHIDSIFRHDGGIYGRFNRDAMVAYVLGIAVQIPFMNTPIYVGPISQYLSGADLSWIVSLVVTSPLYYLLARRTVGRGGRVAPTEPAQPVSSRTLPPR